VWDIGGQSIGGKMLDKYLYGSHVRMKLNPFNFEAVVLPIWRHEYCECRVRHRVVCMLVTENFIAARFPREILADL
jgi:hypothetical protein